MKFTHGAAPNALFCVSFRIAENVFVITATNRLISQKFNTIISTIKKKHDTKNSASIISYIIGAHYHIPHVQLFRRKKNIYKNTKWGRGNWKKKGKFQIHRPMTLEINEVSLTPFAEATIKTSRAARYIVSKLCMFEFGLSNSCFSFDPPRFQK